MSGYNARWYASSGSRRVDAVNMFDGKTFLRKLRFSAEAAKELTSDETATAWLRRKMPEFGREPIEHLGDPPWRERMTPIPL